MNKRSKITWKWWKETILMVGIGLLLGAHASANSGVSDPAVLVIGKEVIRASEIRGILEATNQEELASDPARLKSFLEQYLDQIVVASESVDRGYFTGPRLLTVTLFTVNTAARAFVEQAVTVSEEEVRAFYDANSASMVRPEQRRAAHILIPINDPEKAQEVIQKLNEGMPWEEAVKTYSTDASTKDKNGDLGWIRKGGILPALSDEIFRLDAGKHSETPVQTEYGYHIVRVTEIRPQSVVSYEDVKKQIKDRLLNEKRRNYFQEKMPAVWKELRERMGAYVNTEAISAVSTVEPSFDPPAFLADIERRARKETRPAKKEVRETVRGGSSFQTPTLP